MFLCVTLAAIACTGVYAFLQGPPWELPGVLLVPNVLGGAAGVPRKRTVAGVLWGAVVAAVVIVLS